MDKFYVATDRVKEQLKEAASTYGLYEMLEAMQESVAERIRGAAGQDKPVLGAVYQMLVAFDHSLAGAGYDEEMRK